MTTARRLLQAKGRGPAVFSISPEARVSDALRVMSDKDVGALIVLDEARVVGIVTERDVARKALLHGRLPDYVRVSDGLMLMFWGLFKKVVIADRLGVLVDTI